MDFVFQGFQSGLPLWAYVLLFIGTAILSWWSYKGIKAIPRLYRSGLILLRASVFFILLVLLINPFFKAESTYYEKPNLLVLLDNSSSTGIKKGAYTGEEAYREVLDRLNFKDSSEVSFDIYSVDGDVKPSTPDSLTFSGIQTNLYNAIQLIRDNEEEGRGAVLISDGIFTQGRNPVYESGAGNIPIFTIAVGDTSSQKDLLVKNITSNNTGYVDTRHPVEVTVVNNGFAGQPFNVQIKKGNRVLKSETVTPGSDRSTHSLNFELTPEKEGLQQYEVVIPGNDQEWTTKNNSQPFSIDVLDNKQHILSLAFEIYPDVRFVRSVLLTDEHTELISRTWAGSDRFIEGPLDISADSLDLIVLQGYPESGVPRSLQDKLTALFSSVPSVILSTPLTSLRALEEQISVSLPASQRGPKNVARVTPVPAAEPTAHPIMELQQYDYDRLPPLYAPVQGLNPAPGATTLYKSSFQSRETGSPLILALETGNIRRSQSGGYGWFRIAQSADAVQRKFAEELLLNMVSWTATKPDNRKLKVEPAQKTFTSGEPVLLNAYLTNERGENESDASVEIRISGEGMEQKFYSMKNAGDGRYQLRLNALPEGIYRFEATARKGSRTIDVQEGEFPVTNSNTELVNTIRNDGLLKQLAEKSDGHFFQYDDIAGFWEALNKKGMLDKEEKNRNILFYPYQHSFWFILVIALLGAEWIIRKYFALP